MRSMIRLVVLGLAGYGAWSLYEEYGQRLKDLRGPMREFSARATNATKTAANDISSAAEDATDAVKDSTAEIERAAKDARDNATRTLHPASATSEPA
jgi:hypothetical protein